MNRPEPSEKPLQSWKEIAAYLERDVRTLHRWEKEAGLPVRRHTDKRHASVYAYPSEIDAWRVARPLQAEEKRVPPWRRPRTWVTAAALTAAAAAIVYGPFLNPKAPSAEAAEGSMRSEQVWTDFGDSRLSPNGEWLTYGQDYDLWLRNVSTGESRPISHKEEGDPSGVETNALSPSGKLFAAAWYSDRIKNYELRVGVVPPPGQTEEGKPIFECETGVPGYVEVGGWLTESKVLFTHYVGEESRWLIADLEGGTTTLFKSFQWAAPEEATISRDGRWIAYGVRPEANARQRDIYVIASDGSRESLVVEHPSDDQPAAWSPDGSNLLFRTTRTGGQSLWVLPMADGKGAGQPRMLSSEFASRANVGITPSGDLYYAKSVSSSEIQEARLNKASGMIAGQPAPLDVTVVSNNGRPSYSPDGRRLAYLSNRSLSKLSAIYESVLVVRDLDTGKEVTIEPTFPRVAEPSWAPDSASLLFRAFDNRSGWGFYRVPATGGPTELLFRMKRTQTEPRNIGWMRGGQSIYYGDRHGFWIHGIPSGDEKKILPTSFPRPKAISLSPDGGRFAVMEDLEEGEKNETALYTVDVEGQQRREVTRFPDSGVNSFSPVATAWALDSSAIFYWRKVDGKRKDSPGYELWTAPLAGGEPHKTGLELSRPSPFSIHPNGERIAFVVGEPKLEIWKLSNFLDRVGSGD